TGYLTGDAEEARFNHLTGQSVNVALPATARFPTYSLQGRGLTESDTLINRPDHQAELTLTQAIVPGNYTLIAGSSQKIAGFSMNVANEESDLAKVPQEQIEELFGANSVLPV